jgi:dihydroorotate dehydrogenase electron transfer subunit
MIDHATKRAMDSVVFLKGEVRERKKIGFLYHRLKIFLPQPIPSITPGQFTMVMIDDKGETILPRPFSFHNFEGDNEIYWFDLIFKVVGIGTDRMAKLSAGSIIKVLAPLGNGFPEPPPHSKALLIAGGMGIAPLFALIKRLKASAIPLWVFYGAKSKNDLICLTELLKVEGITVKIATEDGTKGKKGMVTDLLEEQRDEDTGQRVIYACGPEPMLKTVTKFAERHKMPCWVSLEKRMACGIGACLGCAVKTKSGYERVCKEGPIFEAQEIVWEEDA